MIVRITSIVNVTKNVRLKKHWKLRNLTKKTRKNSIIYLIGEIIMAAKDVPKRNHPKGNPKGSLPRKAVNHAVNVEPVNK
jgi:hypothetical protein